MKPNHLLAVVIAIIGIGALGWALLSGGSTDNTQTGEESGLVQVGVSIYPLQFLVEEIGGDQVEFVVSPSAGIDAHSFEPSARQVADLQSADLFVYQGQGIDAWAEELAPELPSSVHTLEATELVPLMATSEEEHEEDAHEEEDEHAHEDEHEHEDEESEEEHADEDSHDHDHDDHSDEEEADDHDEESHEEEEHAHDHDEEHEDEEHADEEGHDDHDHGHNHAHGEFDPHVWLDPGRMSMIAAAIASELSEIDPANAELYEERLNDLTAELSKLDDNYSAGLADCELNEIIVGHDAFQYLSTTYNFNTHPIAGLSPEAEPSAKRLAELTEVAEEIGTEYIFFEALTSPKLSETIANEVGADTLVLDPIEGVTDESDTYITLMESNLENLRTGMQCQ